MADDTMPMGVRVKLSAMMFLQFMMIAVWWVPLAAYLDTLGIAGAMKSTILSTMAFGCLVSPLVGMVADRHFNGEKVLMVLNVLSGILLIIGARITEPVPLFVVLLLTMLCYMPTWGLTSAIAMANSPSEQFPQIRVFGSIGWVCAAVFSVIAVKLMGVETFDGTALPLYCAAGTSFLGAVVALTLPGTPPPAKGQEASVVDALGLRSFGLMKDRYFAIFMIISTLVMIPFAIYWSYCSTFLMAKGFKFLTLTMNLGQFAEMFFMLMVTVALKKMGVKWAMVTGLGALLVRYIAFYLGGVMGIQALYFVAILVHGIIYGFFFVGGQIYVNNKAPREIQAQAQGFLFLVTFGVGLTTGNYFNGWLIGKYSTVVENVTTYDWSTIWGVTAVISLVLLVALAVFFKDDSGTGSEKAPAEAPAGDAVPA
jgi:nucleoside transporter